MPPQDGLLSRTSSLSLTSNDRLDFTKKSSEPALSVEVTAKARRVTCRSRNTWLIVNVGGGPTPDKPSTTLSVLADLDTVSRFVNIHVADIQACYALCKSRGAEFITEPKPK
jgi:hypothetical protein